MNWFHSEKQLPALVAGKQAPQFVLSSMDGSSFSLHEALKRAPVLAVFFKISCPVCQYALPFVERIYQNVDESKFTIVGISQNDDKDTSAFIKRLKITFPTLLEDTKTFTVSNAYGLTTVPAIFLMDQSGQIQVSSVGWSRQDIEEIARKAREGTGQPVSSLFRADEQVPEFRAG